MQQIVWMWMCVHGEGTIVEANIHTHTHTHIHTGVRKKGRERTNKGTSCRETLPNTFASIAAIATIEVIVAGNFWCLKMTVDVR